MINPVTLKGKCGCEYCRNGWATTHNDLSHDQSLYSSFSLLGGTKQIEIIGGTTKAARVALQYFLETIGDGHGVLKGRTAIELGAGTGLLGQALAILGADVVLTDQEPVLEYLKENISQNLGYSPDEGKVEVEGLYWGENALPDGVKAHHPYDMIVCSDLIFAHENIPLLLKTLELLCPVDCKSTIYFSHIDRFKWEDQFFEGMVQNGFNKLLVKEDVDIKVFTFKRALQ